MTDDKKTVLFVCIHNSARSQMAESFLNAIAPKSFEAHSAGIEPGKLNPIVVDAMNDAGIDISGNATKSVQEFIDAKRKFDYIITVCDEVSAQRCPMFPGEGKRIHMGFQDPSSFKGDYEEIKVKTIAVRDQIRARLKQWIKEIASD